jgi:hypothetical protein
MFPNCRSPQGDQGVRPALVSFVTNLITPGHQYKQKSDPIVCIFLWENWYLSIDSVFPSCFIYFFLKKLAGALPFILYTSTPLKEEVLRVQGQH